MKKEFVPYELALKMKALGFDEPCFGLYNLPEQNLGTDLKFGGNSNEYNSKWTFSAPTFSQAFRWFREKHCLQSWIPSHIDVLGYECGYRCCIHQEKSSVQNFGDFKSYEEAELACLENLIEIVEEKID